MIPSSAIMACITGTRSLLNDVCARAFKESSHGAGGGARFAHRMNSLPVWAVVQDEHVLIPAGGYFAPSLSLLRTAGWQVWYLDPNLFVMGWGTEAEDVLGALPESFPAQPRPPTPQKTGAARFLERWRTKHRTGRR